jgi:hypothetical protein
MMYWEQDSREFYDEDEGMVEAGLQVRELGNLGSIDELDEIPY